MKITRSDRSPKVIAVVGATGSGKSALALRLARKFGGVIISADSRQLYRGLTIGTAKPTQREQRAVPHYMIDVISPRQTYSAWQFQQAVYAIVARISRREPGRPIFLVGGTYLYVDSVLKGWDFAGAKLDTKLRTQLRKMSTGEMFRELRNIDPQTAKTIDRHNQRRLLRALEAVHATGKSFYQSRSGRPPAWDVLIFGIDVPQKKLDNRNRLRIDRMFRAGWKKEVEQLAKKNLRSSPGFLAHGYREVLELVNKKKTLAQTKERIAINTRNHAKRQRAWFNKNPQIAWISPHAFSLAQRKVKNFLQKERPDRD